jgi:hypothetical protein
MSDAATCDSAGGLIAELVEVGGWVGAFFFYGQAIDVAVEVTVSG